MGLEQLANLGELVAALGVIVSLVYLAKQINHNTDAMRSNSETMWSTVNVTLTKDVALDREAAEWWVSGGERFGELDEVDQQRHVLWEYSVFHFWWAQFKARQRGQVDDEQWGVVERTIAMFGQRAAIRASWARFRPLFPVDFQRLLDPHLEAPAPEVDA